MLFENWIRIQPKHFDSTGSISATLPGSGVVTEYLDDFCNEVANFHEQTNGAVPVEGIEEVYDRQHFLVYITKNSADVKKYKYNTVLCVSNFIYQVF